MLAGDAPRVGRYGFPQLCKEQLIPSDHIKSFNYLLSTKALGNWWFHCFCDDYQFQRLWYNFARYLPLILMAAGFVAPDFSLYRDFEEDLLVWNCNRNRTLAYAIQTAGGKMIPTAGFGSERTWSWCFDGLPRDSTVAVTTNGILGDPEAMRLFVGGIDAMVSTIHPYAIVVCGKYPHWLDVKYPDIKIVPIPSYSQQWNARRCG